MKGKNETKCHVKIDIYTNRKCCSPDNHASICAFTVVTDNLTLRSSIIMRK